MNQRALEVAGAVFGLTGALLLAARGEWAWVGWAFFLASNLVWLAFAAARRLPWLALQHVGFMATSLIGLVTWRGGT